MFYKDKIVVADRLNKELNLFRRIKNEIIRYTYAKNSTDFIQDRIVLDSLGEFDLNFSSEGLILVYNNKNKLILRNLYTNKSHEIEEFKRNIYELQLLILDEKIHIIYLEKVEGDQASFYIKHILVDENFNVEKQLVDKIKSSSFVSPIKAFISDDKIYISYYYLNHICIKSFDTSTNLWSASMILTDNSNKLYLDLNIKDNRIHLVYSIFNEENFLVKYNRFKIDNDNFIMEKELDVSDYGNNTDPLIIIYEEKLWITWRDSNILVSKFSSDQGDSFSELIRWEESRLSHNVKYKYITENKKRKNIVDYVYGSFYPELRFMGFE